MSHSNFEQVWRSVRQERKKFSRTLLTHFHNDYPSLYERALKINENDGLKMYDEREKANF